MEIDSSLRKADWNKKGRQIMPKKSIILLIYNRHELLYTVFNHMTTYREFTRSLLQGNGRIAKTFHCYSIKWEEISTNTFNTIPDVFSVDVPSAPSQSDKNFLQGGSTTSQPMPNILVESFGIHQNTDGIFASVCQQFPLPASRIFIACHANTELQHSFYKLFF
jgi:hypothetical protein